MIRLETIKRNNEIITYSNTALVTIKSKSLHEASYKSSVSNFIKCYKLHGGHT